MTSDIATQLREFAEIIVLKEIRTAMDSAADEIDRLKEQLRSLETERDYWMRAARYE